jgi:hypothetical protein
MIAAPPLLRTEKNDYPIAGGCAPLLQHVLFS